MKHYWVQDKQVRKLLQKKLLIAGRAEKVVKGVTVILNHILL